MVLVKILKRKDASSVLVAILAALIITQPLGMVTSELAGKISDLHNGQYFGYGAPGTGWRSQYLYPIVWAILQLLILEILGWVYVLGNRPVRKSKKS